jgi:biotin carboxylase
LIKDDRSGRDGTVPDNVGSPVPRPADQRPLLLVIRTGHRDVREYLLRSIATAHRIHMFLDGEPDWELAYICGWTRLDKTRDAAVVTAAAKALHDRDPIAGVLTWDESRLAQTAEVVAALGLPGPTPDIIARCRDKQLTRLALADAGVPQPGSVRVDSLDEALAAAARFGYPVILKPSDLAFSMGVALAADDGELTRLYPYTATVQGGLPGYRATVLVEEFATGTEISVDAVVRHGRVTPLVLARKQLGYPPYCIEVGHYVDAADPLLDDERIARVLHDTHAALGFTDGTTHTELKLGPDGPRVIEVNGRLGGGLIPYLGLRATGIDTALAAAAVACGREPSPGGDRSQVAGVRFCYVSEDDTLIESIGFDRSGLPEGVAGLVDRLVVAAEPGETRSPPPKGTANGRVGLVTAVAPTVDECRAALDAAVATLRINAG